MMRLNSNDPRLIDYALGELSEEETEAIAAALELPENQAARDEVAAIQDLAEASREALAEEPAPALNDMQRADRVAIRVLQRCGAAAELNRRLLVGCVRELDWFENGRGLQKPKAGRRR